MKTTSVILKEVPLQCRDCLNLHPSYSPEPSMESKYDCKAMTSFIPDTENCFARIISTREQIKRLQAIQNYSAKYADKDTDHPVSKEIDRLKARINPTSAEIMCVLFQDMKRGKRGGGGEQEKAPNKRKEKKNRVWNWDEL